MKVEEGIIAVELPFTLRNAWSITNFENGEVTFSNCEDDHTITLGAGPEWILSVWEGKPHKSRLVEEITADEVLTRGKDTQDA